MDPGSPGFPGGGRVTTTAPGCRSCSANRTQNLVQLGVSLGSWDYLVALAGNPNTGKSTVFNALTGLRQHTGNWPGKTVTRAEGVFSLKDKKVKALLLNVFAGINRCDWVAKGVVDAITDLNIKMPVVVRLAGTNVEEGRRILRESGLGFAVASGMDDAARQVVAAARRS